MQIYENVNISIDLKYMKNLNEYLLCDTQM